MTITASDAVVLPKLSATRGDPGRLGRLAAVFSTAAELVAIDSGTPILSTRKMLVEKLSQLDDDRDRLTCLWSSAANESERDAFEASWRLATGDTRVEHLVQPLTGEEP